MTFPIVYTDLAKALLGDSLSAFEEMLRGQLAADGATDIPESLIFHGVEYGNREFIAVGKEGGAPAGVVKVDSATYDDGEELTAGPFKGLRVSMPRPDSE